VFASAGTHPGTFRGSATTARKLSLMRENFSLIVMCIFLIISLAFLAQQFSLYR
jgi:hypothetical protein